MWFGDVVLYLIRTFLLKGRKRKIPGIFSDWEHKWDVEETLFHWDVEETNVTLSYQSVEM